MRIAITGKGGVGKTTLAALVCRRLAESGYPVLAIDADPNPNLGLSLGIPPERLSQQRTLLGEGALIPAQPSQLRKFVHQYACLSPEHIPLLVVSQVQHADVGCLCNAYSAVYKLLEMLGYWQKWITIVDMSPGLENMHRKSIRHVDAVLIVTEPASQSLETAFRLYQSCRSLNIKHLHVVVNNIRSQTDRSVVNAYFAGRAIDVLSEIPYSETLRDIFPPPGFGETNLRLAMQKLISQIEYDYRTRLLCDAAFEISEKFLLIGKSKFNQRELLAVRHLAQTGGMTMKQLSRCLKAAYSTTTAIVDKLAAENYVLRRPDPRDRRVVRVSLSDRGEDVFRNHIVKYEGLLKKRIKNLNEQEQRTLLQLISKMVLTEGV